MSESAQSDPSRRARTTGGHRLIQRLTSRLPRSVERSAVRRLGNLAAGFGGMFLFVVVFRTVVIERADLPIGREKLMLANVVTAAFAVAAWGVFALSRSRVASRVVLKIGLLYELLLCFGIALEEQMIFPFFDEKPSVSFIVVNLLMFPLIVPTPWPRRVVTTVLSSLTPVLALPLVLAISGNPMPELRLILANTGPTVVVGLFALYGARVAHQLRSEATAARKIGAYELVDMIGEGGMGQVWRAEHRLLARSAALKLIRPESLGDSPEQAEARFEREAKATAALASPHTVALYDYGRTDDGTYYYAMELLQGMTLDALIRDHGPVPEERALYVLRQVALSLAEAHESDLVHRDIKPANAIVSRAGLEHDFVKVLDFGLVKSTASSPGDVQLTREHVPTGTPAFMSPEAVLNEPVSGRSDVYSLGCTAYWILTGELVFDETNAVKMMMAHVHEVPVPPSARTELDIDPAVDALVMRCLNKDPLKRIGAAELLDAIEDATEKLARRWTNRDAIEWWSKRPMEFGRVAS